MKKLRNIFVTAILMSAIAASTIFAEAPGSGSTSTTSSAPPGSEGTILTPITVQIPAAVPASDSTNVPQIAADSVHSESSSVITAGQNSIPSGQGTISGPGSSVGPGVSAGPGSVSAPITDSPSSIPQDISNNAQSTDSTTQNTDNAQNAGSGTQNAAASGRVIDPSRPMIALTFDDGPQTNVGNQIMDCLAQYGGKATFFMVGDRVASRASEVKRMVAEGHEVANHTMNHKYLQSLGAAAIQTQVNQCNDVIQAACGVRPRIMRLPGGNHNATVRANTGMPMIQWNVDTLDWKSRNTASIVSKVLEHAKDGDVVLMHELYETTGNAALQIIPELAKRGFQLVTVSEMAAAKGVSLEAGKLYSSF